MLRPDQVRSCPGCSWRYPPLRSTVPARCRPRRSGFRPAGLRGPVAIPVSMSVRGGRGGGCASSHQSGRSLGICVTDGPLGEGSRRPVTDKWSRLSRLLSGAVSGMFTVLPTQGPVKEKSQDVVVVLSSCPYMMGHACLGCGQVVDHVWTRWGRTLGSDSARAQRARMYDIRPLRRGRAIRRGGRRWRGSALGRGRHSQLGHEGANALLQVVADGRTSSTGFPAAGRRAPSPRTAFPGRPGRRRRSPWSR